MTDFIIGIHGISNEMVADAPKMSEKIQEIKQFCEGAVLLAHHAPFDLGFLAVEFEANHVKPPESVTICTSLLARKMIPESVNHKLQTLIKLLNIDGGQAHRALDDARACLHVGLECMNRLGPLTPLSEVMHKVGKDLSWRNYEVLNSAHLTIKKVVEALKQKKSLDIFYEGGSQLKQTRRITPIGLVRNPDGDYVMALCHRDNNHKRFYINKIKDISVAF
jgi:DNA polymerase-3 subunit epsilon